MWVMGQLHVYQHLFPFNQSKDDKWDVMCPLSRDGAEVSGLERRGIQEIWLQAWCRQIADRPGWGWATCVLCHCEKCEENREKWVVRVRQIQTQEPCYRDPQHRCLSSQMVFNWLLCFRYRGKEVWYCFRKRKRGFSSDSDISCDDIWPLEWPESSSTMRSRRPWRWVP